MCWLESARTVRPADETWAAVMGENNCPAGGEPVRLSPPTSRGPNWALVLASDGVPGAKRDDLETVEGAPQRVANGSRHGSFRPLSGRALSVRTRVKFATETRVRVVVRVCRFGLAVSSCQRREPGGARSRSLTANSHSSLNTRDIKGVSESSACRVVGPSTGEIVSAATISACGPLSDHRRPSRIAVLRACVADLLRLGTDRTLRVHLCSRHRPPLIPRERGTPEPAREQLLSRPE